MNNIIGNVSMNGGANAYNGADNVSLGGFDLQQDTGLPSTKSAKYVLISAYISIVRNFLTCALLFS